MIDTGMNIQEAPETLLYQQQRLIDGRRPVQMFPANSRELPLPEGMQRCENNRGVFHYNPNLITEGRILALSAMGRENEFLGLGPYSKADVMCLAGDHYLAITEFTPDWVEVRAALACSKTAPEQLDYFYATKEPANIVICRAPDRLERN
jgi:hypothetical protein